MEFSDKKDVMKNLQQKNAPKNGAFQIFQNLSLRQNFFYFISGFFKRNR